MTGDMIEDMDGKEGRKEGKRGYERGKRGEFRRHDQQQMIETSVIGSVHSHMYAIQPTWLTSGVKAKKRDASFLLVGSDSLMPVVANRGRWVIFLLSLLIVLSEASALGGISSPLLTARLAWSWTERERKAREESSKWGTHQTRGLMTSCGFVEERSDGSTSAHVCVVW